MFRNRYVRQLVSLVLAMVIALLPLQSVQAAAPTVTLTCHQQEAGVGDVLAFTLTGTNTAAVQLMVITPDSKQTFLPGEKVEYEVQQPGQHVFIAYGTTTTNTASPNYQLCMSLPLMMDCGEKALEGNVTFEVLTDEGWQPLQDQYVYNDEAQRMLSFRAILDGEEIPEDTWLTVTLRSEHGSATLLHVPVGSSTSWTFSDGGAIQRLFREKYGWWDVTLEAVLSASGTDDEKSAEAFWMDTYNNEMRYVNLFYLPDFTGYSSRGDVLLKWLDTSERTGNDRIGSGYLLLEQDYKDHSWWLPQAGLNTSKFFSRALELIGSLGTVLIFEHFNEKDAIAKFGPEGMKVYPYYQNLAGLYQNYVADMLQELEQLEYTARLTRELSEQTDYWAVSAKNAKHVTDFVSNGYKLADTVIYSNRFQGADHFSCYLGTNSHSGNIYELIVTDVTYPTVTDPLARQTTAPMIHWETAAGRSGSTYLDEMAASVLAHGDDYYFVSSPDFHQKMNAEQFNGLISAEMNKGVLPLTDPTNPKWGDQTVVLERAHGGFTAETDGTLRFQSGTANLHMSPEIVEKLGLFDSLSPQEQLFITDYQTLRAAAESPDQIAAARRRGTINNAVTLASSGFNAVTSWIAFVSRHKTLSWQLEAYYTIIAQAEIKYVNMLEEWRDAVEKTDIRNAELVYAALDALIEDIRSTSRDTLTELQSSISANAAADTALFSSKEFAAAMYSSIMLAKDVAAITGLTTKLSAIVAQKATAGLTSIRTALKLQGGASAAGTIATTATTLSSFLGTINMLSAFASIGSLVANLITASTFSYEENLQALYQLKQSLLTALYGMLDDYVLQPTPQKASDIIASLEMMKTTKYSGEELCILYRLMDLFEDLEIDGMRAQLVLWNELNSLLNDPDTGIHFEDHLTDVHIIYENTYLGSVRELKDKGVKFDELGLFEKEKESDALGATIVGLYTRGGSSGTYQGFPLQSLPSQYIGLPSTREAAGKFTSKDYAWARLDPGEDPAWLTDGPYQNTAQFYRQPGYLYGRDGLELALSEQEYSSYLDAQKEINDMLAKYLHADEDRLFMPSDQKNYRNLISGLLTRKYIEFLEMYDPTIEYP